MNSSQFKEHQFLQFCKVVGSNSKELTYILGNLDQYYDEWSEKKIDKSTGDFKRYKDGTLKERVIRPPKHRLKEIQTRIKDRLLAPVELPKNIHGGVKRKSNITNAKPHKGHKYQFVTDASNFYPSISNRAVHRMLLKIGMTNHFANWITKLTTWKGEVPQGAPTSTHIANLVFLETDLKLNEFCSIHNLTYTRFIDDLTFSSQQDFQPLLDEILSIIKKGGFKVNHRKTEYGGKQLVTGILPGINSFKAPKAIRDKAQLEAIENKAIKPYTHYVKAIERVDQAKRKASTSRD
jgi:RNA-directed DNA polymerase